MLNTNYLPALLVLVIGIVSGCQTYEDSDTVTTDVANKDGKTMIAPPRPYNPLGNDLLGVNEDGKGLAKGAQITPFSLQDIDGNNYPIERAWSEKSALIIFYRGGWCPYCNMQIKELSDNYPRLEAAGVQPVLISVDEVDNTAKISSTYDIPFPVLSDPGLVAHTEFNVILELDPATLEKYREFGISLADWSGLDHATIAVASAFVIDQTGTVLVSHATRDYSARPSIDQLITLIKTAHQ